KTSRLLLGTSGWSYPEWVGVFYPTSTESKLKHYTQVFPTAEIDSTFYAFPQPGTVLGWNRFSPKEFSFCAKIPQTITHDKLVEIGPSLESELDRFAELMLPLNNSGKLGACFSRCRPSTSTTCPTLRASSRFYLMVSSTQLSSGTSLGSKTRRGPCSPSTMWDTR